MDTSFSSLTLAEIIRDAFLEERTGTLELARGEAMKRISFDRGMIVAAESGEAAEDLGRRLVADGKISSGALAEAVRAVKEPNDLHQALVNRGLVTREGLQQTARVILNEVLEEAFRWDAGTARFDEAAGPPEALESDVVSTFEVLLHGVRGMASFDTIREAMKGVSNRLALQAPSPVPVDRLALSPAHGYILSRVDGTSSVADVLSLLPPDEEDLACRFLYGLLVMGVIRFDPPFGEGPFRVAAILRDHADTMALETAQERMVLEAVERSRNRSAHEVLGLPPNPDRQILEQTYEEAKERFSRDKIMPRVREKYRAELALLEGRFIEAYLLLSQVRPGDSKTLAPAPEAPASPEDLLVRVEMDKTQTKVALEESARVAEGHYNKARKFMRDGDFHNAIQYCKLAISYAAEDPRFYFLLGECQARNPEVRWQRMAEQSYLRAAELDPWNPEYRLSLGRFYKTRGLNLRARKQFEEILQMVPGHAAAQSELEALA